MYCTLFIDLKKMMHIHLYSEAYQFKIHNHQVYEFSYNKVDLFKMNAKDYIYLKSIKFIAYLLGFGFEMKGNLTTSAGSRTIFTVMLHFLLHFKRGNL